MQSKIRGVQIQGGAEIDIKANSTGDLLVANYLPKYASLALTGCGAIVQATTAVASVTADPTTASLGTLYNGSSTKKYIIDRIFFDTAASDESKKSSHHLVYCIQPAGVTTTRVADITIKNMNGGSYSGDGIFDVGHTAVDHGWFSIGNSVDTGQLTANGGMSYSYNVDGRIILDPTTAIALSVVGSDADVTVMVGISWFEVTVTGA